MSKRQRILFFIVAMIFITITAITSFKAVAGDCSELCTDPNEPCCCEQKDGYYLEFYMCTCGNGEMQQQECKYAVIP